MELLAATLILTSQVVLLPLVAPLFFGIMRRAEAFMAGECGPPVLQPYHDLIKTAAKDARLPSGAAPVLPALALLLLSLVVVATSGVPTVSLALPGVAAEFGLPLFAVSELTVLVMLLVFVTLVRETVGSLAGAVTTEYGTLRRLLAPAVVLLALLPLSLISQSSDVFGIVDILSDVPYYVHLPVIIAAFALIIGALGEGAADMSDIARVASVGLLSGKILATIRFADALLFTLLTVLVFNVFLPSFLPASPDLPAVIIGMGIFFVKFVIAAALLPLLGRAFRQRSERRRAELVIAALFLALLANIIFLGIYV